MCVAQFGHPDCGKIRRPCAETGYTKLLDDEPKPLYEGTQGIVRRLQHARGYPCKVRAETHRLRYVDAGFHAPRRDNCRIRTGAAGLLDGLGGGNTPIHEGIGERGLSGVFDVCGFDCRPAGAACPRHINNGNPRLGETPDERSRQTAADLLDRKRHRSASATATIFSKRARPIPVTFRLHGLLDRIEMDIQRVRVDHVGRALGPSAPKPRLNCAAPRLSMIGTDGALGRSFSPSPPALPSSSAIRCEPTANGNFSSSRPLRPFH